MNSMTQEMFLKLHMNRWLKNYLSTAIWTGNFDKKYCSFMLLSTAKTMGIDITDEMSYEVDWKEIFSRALGKKHA